MDGTLEEEIEKLEISSIKADRRRVLKEELDSNSTDTIGRCSTNSSLSYSSRSTNDPEMSAISLPSSSSLAEEIRLPSYIPHDKNEKRRGFFSMFCRKSKSKEEGLDFETIRIVTVDNLPQVFLVKYLGRSHCQGFRGIRMVRQPIDKLLENVGSLTPDQDLPLVAISVSEAGIHVSPHPRSQGAMISPMNFPIHFISYGVQDIRYSRVFSIIIVREMNGRYVPECHAFVCANTIVGRRLALSLNLAYQGINRKMTGPQHCALDLRTPADIVEKILRRDEAEV